MRGLIKRFDLKFLEGYRLGPTLEDGEYTSRNIMKITSEIRTLGKTDLHRYNVWNN